MYVGLTFEFWRENGKPRADRIWKGEKGRKPEFEVGGTPGIICMSDEHLAQVAQQPPPPPPKTDVLRNYAKQQPWRINRNENLLKIQSCITTAPGSLCRYLISVTCNEGEAFVPVLTTGIT